jgi:three-Cys-motif partner protein
MARQKFGGIHTTEKLDRLTAYLKAFTTALKNQSFELAYLDAFAGTGEIQVSDRPLSLIEGADTGEFVEGSVKRALTVDPPFNTYTFIELRPTKAADLRRRIASEHPSAATTVLVGDANDKIREWIAAKNWRSTRGVVFLDPFGSQVTWDTLERLAATRAVDVWYLFPAGLSVLRQIGRDGNIDAEHRASIDGILGTDDWPNALVRKSQKTDLFGDTDDQVEYRANAEQITQYMRERMGQIFQGGVNPNSLPLGSRNVHMYSLMFACANPSSKAWMLAQRLATAVLKSKGIKRSK